MAYKYCDENGTWYRHPESNQIWSNYTTCVNLQDLSNGSLYSSRSNGIIGANHWANKAMGRFLSGNNRDSGESQYEFRNKEGKKETTGVGKEK
ncbi:Calcitonin receptor [Harpegnathos saltator]|uniref:Calcitonin receptor n=1 Tax=Harpegnathos saltator TaxID=610380 RepID=E2BN40_HARSA|nr:Calcitonin receptor [Harpegnathos saltator]